jgi:hypothetical protein
MQTVDRRSASVKACSDVVLTFKVSKANYQEILHDYSRFKKFSRMHFLQSIPFFKAWPETKLLDLNDEMSDI